MKAVVVGLGKVGLPVAVNAAAHGVHVTGCDINPAVCEAVQSGQTNMPNEAGLREALLVALENGTLTTSTDTAGAVGEGADLVIVVPPLLVNEDHEADWRHMDSALADVGAGLASECGAVVSVETTLPVGSTRAHVRELLEQASGLIAERDFHVVASPERVFSGRILQDLQTYPKLIGGLSPTGEERAAVLYRQFIEAEVRCMGSAEAAELTKLAETTYRDINIAFANEIARFADSCGVDVREVIEAANSQPFSHIHSPGISVGGHCIPVYPHFYLQGDPEAKLPRHARAINDSMPSYGVTLLEKHLDLTGARVLILGITYRGQVAETAFSGAMPLRDELARRGAVPVACDPLLDPDSIVGLGFTPWDGGPIDGAIVHTDHPEYRELTPSDLPGARVLIDGRGIVNPESFANSPLALKRIGS